MSDQLILYMLILRISFIYTIGHEKHCYILVSHHYKSPRETVSSSQKDFNVYRHEIIVKVFMVKKFSLLI